MLPSSIDTTAEQLFQDSAGIIPDQLQSAISLLLVTSMIIWGVWIIISTAQEMHQSHISFAQLAARLLVVFVLISVSISLVYRV